MQHGPFTDHLPIMVMFHDFPYVKLLDAIWIMDILCRLVVWNMAFIFPFSWEFHHPN